MHIIYIGAIITIIHEYECCVYPNTSTKQSKTDILILKIHVIIKEPGINKFCRRVAGYSAFMC
jgi:hypothetical protein